MVTVYIYECPYCAWNESHYRDDLELKCPVCGSEMDVMSEEEE